MTPDSPDTPNDFLDFMPNHNLPEVENESIPSSRKELSFNTVFNQPAPGQKRKVMGRRETLRNNKRNNKTKTNRYGSNAPLSQINLAIENRQVN